MASQIVIAVLPLPDLTGYMEKVYGIRCRH